MSHTTPCLIPFDYARYERIEAMMSAEVRRLDLSRSISVWWVITGGFSIVADSETTSSLAG